MPDQTTQPTAEAPAEPGIGTTEYKIAQLFGLCVLVYIVIAGLLAISGKVTPEVFFSKVEEIFPWFTVIGTGFMGFRTLRKNSAEKAKAAQQPSADLIEAVRKAVAGNVS